MAEILLERVQRVCRVVQFNNDVVIADCGNGIKKFKTKDLYKPATDKNIRKIGIK